EHGHGALVGGHDLDGDFGQAEVDGFQQAPAGQFPAQAHPPAGGVDDQAQLADVAGPPHAGHDGDDAGDAVVVDGDQPAGPLVAGPRRHPGGVEGVGFQKGPVTFGDAGDEGGQGGGVGGGDRT